MHYLFMNVKFAIIWPIKASSKHLGLSACGYFWSLFRENRHDWQFQNTGCRVNTEEFSNIPKIWVQCYFVCVLPYRCEGASTRREWFWQSCCWYGRRRWVWWGASLTSPDQKFQQSPFEFVHGRPCFRAKNVKLLTEYGA